MNFCSGNMFLQVQEMIEIKGYLKYYTNVMSIILLDLKIIDCEE